MENRKRKITVLTKYKILVANRKVIGKIFFRDEDKLNYDDCFLQIGNLMGTQVQFDEEVNENLLHFIELEIFSKEIQDQIYNEVFIYKLQHGIERPKKPFKYVHPQVIINQEDFKNLILNS